MKTTLGKRSSTLVKQNRALQPHSIRRYSTLRELRNAFRATLRG
jgi:hypothetical protein